MTIEKVVEHRRLGTGGALKNALSRYPCDEFMAVNGDNTFSNHDWINTFIRDWQESDQLRIMVATAESGKDYGAVKINTSCQISEFQEKGIDQRVFISSGHYLMKRELLDLVNKEEFSLEHDIFEEFTKQGKLIPASFCRDAFLDFGSPDKVEKSLMLMGE